MTKPLVKWTPNTDDEADANDGGFEDMASFLVVVGRTGHMLFNFVRMLLEGLKAIQNRIQLGFDLVEFVGGRNRRSLRPSEACPT